MATHESINRARDDDDYTVHEASRYVSQEDHGGGLKSKCISRKSGLKEGAC